MNHCMRTMMRGLSLYLCLIGWAVGTFGQPRPQTVTDTQQPLADPISNSKWQKVYSEDKGAYFKTVYSAPLQWGKASHLRWLWMGDGNGFVRMTIIDTESSTLLGSEKNPALQTYFALSKIGVVAPTAFDNKAGAAVNALLFVEQDAGYLLKGNKLFRTDNAGVSWNLSHQVPNLSADNSVATLQSIAMMPSKRACMVGMYSQPNEVKQSLVMCTEKSLGHDDPQWKPVVVPTQTQLWHISFINDRVGWIVGTVGTILKTEDGGKTWRPIPIEAESLLQSYFLNEKEGWIVGRFGTILHTINGGETWDAVETSFSARIADISLRSIKFAPNNKNGWITGDQGTILYTSDGGNNWQIQQLPSPRESELNALFVDETFCWAVGGNSTVWRYRWK